MSTTQEIKELKEILMSFIKEQQGFNNDQRKTNKELIAFKDEQTSFNKEQIAFNKEQKSFNERIEQKIDSQKEELVEKISSVEEKIDLVEKRLVKKIDGTQYFLEKHVADVNSMLLGEQKDLEIRIDTVETEVQEIQPQVSQLSRRVGVLEVA